MIAEPSLRLTTFTCSMMPETMGWGTEISSAPVDCASTWILQACSSAYM
jgi:hypothetical protein